jgi:CubicO group peptidase (beta-lactamase class C family)
VIQSACRLKELDRLISNERPAFQPGAKFSYSNTGDLLLGMLIERASELMYENYVRQHVFEPAGMRSTSVWPGPASGRAIGLTAMSREAQARPDIPGRGRGPRAEMDARDGC